MIRIYLNDQEYHLETLQSLHDFLKQNTTRDFNFAVAINTHFVPRPAWEKTLLQADDRIDLIVPMQGG